MVKIPYIRDLLQKVVLQCMACCFLEKNWNDSTAVMSNGLWGEGKGSKKGAINREMWSYGKNEIDSGNF